MNLWMCPGKLQDVTTHLVGAAANTGNYRPTSYDKYIYIYIEIHKHVREDDNITEGKGEIQKKKWPINSHREHNALCNYRMGPEDTNIRIRERARARVSHRVFRTTGTIHSV